MLSHCADVIKLLALVSQEIIEHSLLSNNSAVCFSSLEN